MTTEPMETDDRKFVPNCHYEFNPPVETNCYAVAGKEWERKSFSVGWCLRFEVSRDAFVFQSKPVGEKGEYYFFVEWGKGSVAQNIPPPKLKVVK